jgi:hypothetical protein
MATVCLPAWLAGLVATLLTGMGVVEAVRRLPASDPTDADAERRASTARDDDDG